jgi:lipoic acid synthetase
MRKPEWLRKKIDFDRGRATSALMAELDLNTVCKEAKCPNISECYQKHHATFLILGKKCTRHCSFCNVEKTAPLLVDPDEPVRVARAVEKMGLKHVVITSVTRDDLADGGASLFARTVAEIKKSGNVDIELLIPDLKADKNALQTVVLSKPKIIGHNVETVPRLYSLRPGADYKRSIAVLKIIKEIDAGILTKSALMLGLGEKEDEVLKTVDDLREVGCDFLALGQYLRPALKNTEVVEYIPPERFENYKAKAYSLGFKHVESAPYVRSSYHASVYLKDL